MSKLIPAGLVLASCLAWPVSVPAQQSEPEPDSELRTYQDWSVRCVKSNDGDEACVLFQRVTMNDNGGRPVAVMRVQKNVVRSEEEGPVDIAVVIAPLGVHLPSGLALRVDDGEPVELTFEHCDRRGCYAGMKLTAELRSKLMEGSTCQISFTNLAGETITPSLSLSGFTDGYNSF